MDVTSLADVIGVVVIGGILSLPLFFAYCLFTGGTKDLAACESQTETAMSDSDDNDIWPSSDSDDDMWPRSSISPSYSLFNNDTWLNPIE